MRKIKAVIFDVDGVLLDTVPYHFQAWKQLFDKQNIPFTNDDYITKVNGLPRLVGIANIMPYADQQTIQQLAEEKQRYLTQMFLQRPPKPLPGVISLFNKLKKKGIKLAAASSSKNAPFLLKQAQLTDFFSVIISGSDFSKSKPDPELFLLAGKKLKIKPQQCLVIEDASIGIQAAKNGHMKTIGLLSSNDASIVNLADFTIDSIGNYKTIVNFICS